MPVTLQCPNLRCRSVLQVPDIARGRSVRCGRCGIAFLVPIKTTDAQKPVGVSSDAGEPPGGQKDTQAGKKKKKK